MQEAMARSLTQPYLVSTSMPGTLYPGLHHMPLYTPLPAAMAPIMHVAPPPLTPPEQKVNPIEQGQQDNLSQQLQSELCREYSNLLYSYTPATTMSVSLL